MKYLCLFLSTAGLLFFATGCCSSCHGDGVAYSRSERRNRHKEIAKNDCQQLNDDWDSFWLNDRKGHLSQWNIE